MKKTHLANTIKSLIIAMLFIFMVSCNKRPNSIDEFISYTKKNELNDDLLKQDFLELQFLETVPEKLHYYHKTVIRESLENLKAYLEKSANVIIYPYTDKDLFEYNLITIDEEIEDCYVLVILPLNKTEKPYIHYVLLNDNNKIKSPSIFQKWTSLQSWL
jgi:hypothetical protein